MITIRLDMIHYTLKELEVIRDEMKIRGFGVPVMTTNCFLFWECEPSFGEQSFETDVNQVLDSENWEYKLGISAAEWNLIEPEIYEETSQDIRIED